MIVLDLAVVQFGQFVAHGAIGIAFILTSPTRILHHNRSRRTILVLNFIGSTNHAIETVRTIEGNAQKRFEENEPKSKRVDHPKVWNVD